MKTATLICTLAALLPVTAVSDEQFRCGQWLVSSDTPVAELLKKCGEPSSKEVSSEDVRTRVAGGGTEKIGTATKEVWHYDRGSRAEPMIVTIIDGKIESMERGK
ncbi:MAG TPA: DUF2845 domain-containing protein [Candidatus Dormibacteraeota bacterium]|nr:DUF2845 domain-containing protein [Candidatus Dormibacteraeota bacterium]